MNSTARILRTAARYISQHGLHTGEQFAEGATLDICAAIYMAAQAPGASIPAAFYTDQAASMDILEASEDAMAALRALSASITNYAVPDTNGQPDVIEHVFNWTATRAINCAKPPTLTEVIGRMTRTADDLDQTTAHAA
ncbi:hypothetical protein HZZ00_37795 (plasmid) [Streptomyces sp. NEAU-sy36]|uniref:DUF6197 family protein n=1 Tax=unclassified Streptomyces TaxID=2593676 RepID=UPI0015D5D807|nr:MULTISPECIES: hypothetical protein [unclassified Streptomyces]QLJ06785.1 hypothetical protein HZZ00_37795 [Streptomyces sp. NEAU-sy36]